MEPDTIQRIFEAAGNSEWLVFAGLVLMVLIWIGRKFTVLKKLPSKYVPLVNVSVLVLVAIADSLMANNHWYESIASGFTVAGPAALFWSTLGKFVLPLPDADEK